MAARVIYRVQNAVRPTTAAPTKKGTGTAVRTMLQIASLSTRGLGVVGWGVSLDGSSAATPGQWELFGNTVAASGLTALAATDVNCYTDENAVASDTLMQFGTALTGFTDSTTCTEGTVANYRMFDTQMIAPTSQYIYKWPLGEEPMIDVSQFIRVRCTLAAAVNAYVWVDVFSL